MYQHHGNHLAATGNHGHEETRSEQADSTSTRYGRNLWTWAHNPKVAGSATWNNGWPGSSLASNAAAAVRTTRVELKVAAKQGDIEMTPYG
jgi:hypothetical protein